MKHSWKQGHPSQHPKFVPELGREGSLSGTGYHLESFPHIQAPLPDVKLQTLFCEGEIPALLTSFMSSTL
jgi:hypothetical protein